MLPKPARWKRALRGRVSDAFNRTRSNGHSAAQPQRMNSLLLTQEGGAGWGEAGLFALKQ